MFLPSFRPYVRPREEMAEIHGEAVLGEARLAADGRLDILQWSRPQNDGPALRALALMRYWRNESLRPLLPLAAMRALIEADLDYTVKHWREPCYDIWEEHRRRHYHTQIAQFAALSDGAEWARSLGDARRAENSPQRRGRRWKRSTNISTPGPALSDPASRSSAQAHADHAARFRRSPRRGPGGPPQRPAQPRRSQKPWRL